MKAERPTLPADQEPLDIVVAALATIEQRKDLFAFWQRLFRPTATDVLEPNVCI
jgi:hypothetical protein